MPAEYSIRDILLWIGGTLTAAVIVIFGVVLVVDCYLAFSDPTDRMEQRGGLTPEQETGKNR